jgi:hypothetical protein
MAAIATAVDTEFTPAAGQFIAQVVGGTANLMRANASGQPFASVGIIHSAVIVDNPIAGAVYKFTSATGAVRADQ